MKGPRRARWIEIAVARVVALEQAHPRSAAAAGDHESAAAFLESLVGMCVPGDEGDGLLGREERGQERPLYVRFVTGGATVGVRRMVREHEHTRNRPIAVELRQRALVPVALLGPGRVAQTVLVGVEQDEREPAEDAHIPALPPELREARRRVL